MPDQRLSDRTEMGSIAADDLFYMWTTATGQKKLVAVNLFDFLPIGSGKIQFLIGRDDNGDDDRIDAKFSSIETTVGASGSGALIMMGRFKINRVHGFPNILSFSLSGIGGPDSCEWYKGTAASAYFMINAVGTGANRCHVSKITFTGDWQTTQAEVSGSRPVVITSYEEAIVSDCVVKDGSSMGLTINLCDRADIINTRLYRMARDVVNVSNTYYARIIDCQIQFCADDAIGYNLSDAYKTAINQENGILIHGCRINQCNGFKILGARHITITNNRLHAPRLYAAFIGDDQSFSEGDRQVTDLIISGNHISDLLTHDVIGVSNVINTGIFINSTYNVLRTTIHDNTIISRANGSSVAFNTLGFGLGNPSRTEHRLFNKTGWTNPTVTYTGGWYGIRIECPNALNKSDIRIHDNYYSGLSSVGATSRMGIMWTGSYNWVIPSGTTPQEFPQTHRITVADWGKYYGAKLELNIGANGGVNGAKVILQYSTNSGSTWTDLQITTLTGSQTNTTIYPAAGSASAIVDTVNTILRVAGHSGNGSTALTVTGLFPRVESLLSQ